MFFTPKTATNFYITCHVSQLNTFQSTEKASTVDLSRLNTLGWYQNRFLTAKRYDKQSHPFHIGVPPPSLHPAPH